MAELDLVLAAESAELDRLHQAVDAFAAAAVLPADAAFHIQLALDELVTNIINYGFSGGGRPGVATPSIRIHATVADACVRLTLRDNGAAFDPFTEAPEPDLEAPLAERPIGGLGVYLVKQLMDQVSYRRDGADNCIELMLRLAR